MSFKLKKFRYDVCKFLISNGFPIPIIILSLMCNLVMGQSESNLPCYSIAKKMSEPVSLYEFNPEDNIWKLIGSTNKFNIHSIAIDSESSTIYAVDSGTLGKLNPVTAQFEAIGEIGSGHGDYGYITFDNIRGLAYHPAESALYATHNIPGFESESNDLLLKINPSTGEVIRSAMINTSAFNGVDYARIETTYSLTINGLVILDINDIAIHPYSGEIYAFHKQGSPAVLSILNQYDGNVERVIIDVSALNVGGLGFDINGDLYGTSLADFLDNTISTYRKFDVFLGSSELLGPVDPSADDRTSFICFDCVKTEPKVEDCIEESNITNYVMDRPYFKAKETINSNATLTFPAFFSAGSAINLDSNFEVIPDTALSITAPQVLFSAEIDNSCP